MIKWLWNVEVFWKSSRVILQLTRIVMTGIWYYDSSSWILPTLVAFGFLLWRYYDVFKYQPPPPRDHVSHPQQGETLEPVCTAAVLVMHHTHHSLPQHHSSRQQQQWSHSGNLGPGTVAWYQGCLLSTRLIQKIFVKLNIRPTIIHKGQVMGFLA